MKIRIYDEYSSEGGEFKDILDEYSQEKVTQQLVKSENEQSSYGKSDENSNSIEEELSNNGFDVTIQYLEDVDSNNYNNINKESHMRNNEAVNDECSNLYSKEDLKYASYMADKYREYDKFCYNQKMNYDYKEEVNCDYKEEMNYENINEEIKNNKYKMCSQEINNNYDTDYTKEYIDEYGSGYKETCKVTKGKINVVVKLGDKCGIEIKGAKVNLYELNGVCPKLYESKLTGSRGEVSFDNLEDGCYRVISLVDRRFFEKPSYVTWNEVTIDNCIKEANICVVNRLKPSCCKR